MTNNNQLRHSDKFKILVIGEEETPDQSWRNQIDKSKNDFVWCYTQNRLAFIHLLVSCEPQIIILDKGRTEFTAYDAYYLVNQIFPEVPVIALVENEEECCEWERIGVSLYALRGESSSIGNLFDCLLLNIDEGGDISFNLRLMDKIQENIDGLGKIRAFLESGISADDTFSQGIASEIDHSIHYLKKLKSNLRNG